MTVNGEHAEISDWEMYHNNTTVLISGEQNTTGPAGLSTLYGLYVQTTERGREEERQRLKHSLTGGSDCVS